MGSRFFNTLSRKVEEFVPLDSAGKRVAMYCCGPTVYDVAHIGNWRTFVFGDLVRRWLEFNGYAVRHVMNITDVEDKIIRRVRESHVPLGEFTGQYEAAFFEDLSILNCLRPHHTPRASEHIPEIIELISRLIARGIAYQSSDGSVYFGIENFRGCGGIYGQLLNLNIEGHRVGERIATDEYEKEAVADFALWKSRTSEDGDVFWASPWGEGRPGWHIECSAMSMKYLGDSFDLHLGGEDLIFPHHEDEIAQSEGALARAQGQRFVKYWLHGAHLMVEGKKMSKSLGNYFTIRDLVARGFTGREIRFLLLSARYRDSLNFTLRGLDGARVALRRLDECLAKLSDLAAEHEAPPDKAPITPFTEALEDDLNVSACWRTIFDWVSDLNRKLSDHSVSPVDAAAALAVWKKIDSVLGIAAPANPIAPPEIMRLVESRQAARNAKDYRLSDAIRDELAAKGWRIEDTARGPRPRPIKKS